MIIMKTNTFNLAESNRYYPYTYWKTDNSNSLEHRIQKVCIKEKLKADNAYSRISYCEL